MAPTAVIDEPFLLSNYSVTQSSSKSSSGPENRLQQASVCASYQKPSASPDGFVSVAAQSDGIHVVDIATLHPIISHTLGPSTSFTCPPLTLNLPSKSIHTTFAVISSSSDLDSAHRGKTIWKWSDNPSRLLAEGSSSSSRSQHQAVVVPHLVAGLYDCEGLPDRILAISPTGGISLLTTDLELKTTHSAFQGEKEEKEERIVFFSCTFSGAVCSFLASPSEGAVIVLLRKRGTPVHIEVYCVDRKDSIECVFTHEVPLDDTEIVAVSFSNSGILNIILSAGSWHTFLLTPSSISTISPPLHLRNLLFVSSSSRASSTKKTQSQDKAPSPTNTPSLLALTSSHVLLASRTLQNEIALLLWDTQYSSLLASHILPLSSSLATQNSPITVSLVSPGTGVTHAGHQQAILVISQSTSVADGKTPKKSSIYVVPYSVPARSTIANAIGHISASTRWLAGIENGGKGKSAAPQDAAKAKVIMDIRAAVGQNRTQAPKALLEEWEKKERERLANELEVIFDYNFVRDIMEAVIQPEKPPNPLYSFDLVRHVIESGVVRSSMLNGGILSPLRLRNDWPSIDLALRHVPDLSENELIETLSIVVNSNPIQPVITDPNAMQVDSTSSTLDQAPSLSEYLASMLKHRQFTHSQLTIAFRCYLRPAEAVTSIMHLLYAWFKHIQSQEVKLVPGKHDTEKNEHGVFVIKKNTARPKTVDHLPTMTQISDFLQSLLDASFLVLIQHPPAHKLLKNLKANIESEILKMSCAEQLRGFVEGFAKVHATTLRRAEMGKVGNVGDEGSKKDRRQCRQEAREQVGMAIGVYQLEELVL